MGINRSEWSGCVGGFGAVQMEIPEFGGFCSEASDFKWNT